MRVIPVIDLMHGVVVRGVGGRRDEYQPIRSILTTDARPPSVGAALTGAGFREIYLADLDAIAGSEPAWPVYSDFMSVGLDLCIDAGLSHVEMARRLAHFSVGARQVGGVVAGLESLPGPDTLAEMCRVVGSDRLVFSLDLKQGVPLTSSPAWRGLNARQIAMLALRAGVRRIIVLDLASVGMDAGVTTAPLCRQLGALKSNVQIVAGGGVRDRSDLRVLSAAGCDAALVASALHDGRLSAVDCALLR